MADVSIKYKGAVKAELNSSGTKTIKTAGKYCEGDITVEYTDPQKPTQSKTVTPTASGFTLTPDSGKVLSEVHINGDPDLTAQNVRKNVNIFGVVGTMEEGIQPSGTKTITENGTYDVSDFAQAAVNIPSTAKTGSITPTTGSQTLHIPVTGISNIIVKMKKNISELTASSLWFAAASENNMCIIIRYSHSTGTYNIYNDKATTQACSAVFGNNGVDISGVIAFSTEEYDWIAW